MGVYSYMKRGRECWGIDVWITPRKRLRERDIPTKSQAVRRLAQLTAEADPAGELNPDERRFSVNETATSVVYFIQAENGLIKIGTARNIRKRVWQLTSASPEALSLLATMPGGVREETELHARFKASLHHGEWFSPCEELLALVQSLRSTDGQQIAKAAV